MYQLNNSYIVHQTNDGFVLIQQQYAHQRVLFEKLVAAKANKQIPVQQSMFPESITLTPPDALLLTDLLPDMQILGYNIEPFGNNSFVLHGTPADIRIAQGKQDIESLLEHYKNYSNQYKISKRERLAMTMCWQQSIKLGTALTTKEMLQLVQSLQQCEQPNTSPYGKKITVHFTENYLQNLF